MSDRPLPSRTLPEPVRRSLSRRAVLRGAGGAGLAGLLSACGAQGPATGGAPTAGGPPSPSTRAAQDRSATEKVVHWANWTLYLDQSEDGKRYPTLEKFTKATGIRATYAEDIEDNDVYYGKIQGQLKNGDDIGKDIVVFTDWMAGRMIRNGYVQQLDKANIPNAENLLPQLQNVGFDPGRVHTLTWQSGFAGLAWNKTRVPRGLWRVSDLWRPELKGRVEVLSELRDTVGLVMLEQGKDISADFTEDDFMAAIDVLQKQVDSGQIRQVKGNSYKEDLISGDALAVIAWSGDITQINFENGDKWEFAIPESGGTLWSDNLMIPIGSPHKTNAEKLFNFYYDPQIAAEVAAYVNFICPVRGAREAMEKIDPELVDDPLIFPTEDVLNRVKNFRPLTPDEEVKFNQAFQAVIGA